MKLLFVLLGIDAGAGARAPIAVTDGPMAGPHSTRWPCWPIGSNHCYRRSDGGTFIAPDGGISNDVIDFSADDSELTAMELRAIELTAITTSNYGASTIDFTEATLANADMSGRARKAGQHPARSRKASTPGTPALQSAGLPGTCLQPRLPFGEKATFPMGCERALPPLVSEWRARLRRELGGSCTGPESPAIEAQCNEAESGAWSLAEAQNETEAEQACRVGCLACTRCAYVSVSWKKRMCGWYSACDTSRLVRGADGASFRTHFVRELGHAGAWSAKSVRQWRRHRMLSGANASAASSERGPRIWVIDTSVDECRNSRQGKDLFEEKLAALFRTGFLKAASPADADFLYHPACLVDAFFRLRGRGSRELRVIESAVVREVEAATRAAVKRTPVIVNSLRCYTRRPAAFTLGPVREEIPYGFPILWGGHRFLRFCAEAHPVLDQELSLYLPYCPATPWVVPPGLSPNFNRSVKVLFQGGVRTGVLRFRAIGALRHTPGAKLVAIDPARKSQYNTSFGADDDRLTPMREATYTLCPAGHTPESQRIYQAIR